MNYHTLDTICKTVGHFHATKHIFICADQSKPKCCNYEESIVSWEHLKKRAKEINIAAKSDETGTNIPKQLFSVSRTKANCLQVCVPQSGPIVVVYPEGIWYHSCTPEVLDLILESHIRNGIPLEQYRFNKGNQIESNSLQPQPNSIFVPTEAQKHPALAEHEHKSAEELSPTVIDSLSHGISHVASWYSSLSTTTRASKRYQSLIYYGHYA
eukprot:gene33795-43673_t